MCIAGIARATYHIGGCRERTSLSGEGLGVAAIKQRPAGWALIVASLLPAIGCEHFGAESRPTSTRLMGALGLNLIRTLFWTIGAVCGANFVWIGSCACAELSCDRPQPTGIIAGSLGFYTQAFTRRDVYLN